jgi:hypothetical protein
VNAARRDRPIQAQFPTCGVSTPFAQRRGMKKSPIEGRELSRREFSVEALMALFAGVAITVTACGGDDYDGGPTGPGVDGRSGAISANHSHEAIVTSVQINAGNAVTLNIRGNADHPHTVDLTSAEVVQIGGGTRVTKTSSTDSSAAFGVHAHTVTFN